MRKLLVSLLALAVLILPLVGNTYAQDDDMAAEPAIVTLAHLVPDAPAVDVYVNEDVVFDDLSYLSDTDQLFLEETEVTFQLVPAGGSMEDAVYTLALTLEPGHDYFIAAVGSLEEGSLDTLVLDRTAQLDNLGDLSGQSALAVVHAVPGGPTVDVRAGDEVVVEGLLPGEVALFAAPQGIADLVATVSGEPESVLAMTEEFSFEPSASAVALVSEGEEVVWTGFLVDFISLGDTAAWLGYYVDNPPQPDGGFSIMLQALETSGLLDELDELAPLVLGAPIDAAFAELPADELDALLADPDALRELLEYHIIPGSEILELDIEDLGETYTYTTLSGEEVSIAVGVNQLTVNDSATTLGFINVTDELVIAALDGVLMPPAE
jgi:uncharacterized surface protein with fasciclin (FAS1) repeats